MNEKSAPRARSRAKVDATQHVRSLLAKNIDANVRGQNVEKRERSWTRKRSQGRILWIKKLTE
jgi:hypothetical protein